MIPHLEVLEARIHPVAHPTSPPCVTGLITTLVWANPPPVQIAVFHTERKVEYWVDEHRVQYKCIECPCPEPVSFDSDDVTVPSPQEPVDAAYPGLLGRITVNVLEGLVVDVDDGNSMGCGAPWSTFQPDHGPMTVLDCMDNEIDPGLSVAVGAVHLKVDFQVVEF